MFKRFMGIKFDLQRFDETIPGLNFHDDPNPDNDYYEISSPNDFIIFANYVNGDGTDENPPQDCSDLTFKLTANIDLINTNFTTITNFAGTFDGGQYLIKTDKDIFSSSPDATIIANFYNPNTGNTITITGENGGQYRNTIDSIIINGTDGNDTIANSASNVTIKSGAGDDDIDIDINAGSNDLPTNISIDSGAGDDDIDINSGSNISIDNWRR